MTEPTPTHLRPYHSYSLAMLERDYEAAQQTIKRVDAIRTAINGELRARYEAAVEQRLGAGFGTVHIPAEDGYSIKGVVAKKVSWDSAKLMAVAATMPWPTAERLFKIVFSVPEKVYTALLDDDLRAKLDAARTVKSETSVSLERADG